MSVYRRINKYKTKLIRDITDIEENGAPMRANIKLIKNMLGNQLEKNAKYIHR